MADDPTNDRPPPSSLSGGAPAPTGHEVRATFGDPDAMAARAAGDDTPPVLSGHFARFDQWNEIFDPYDGRFLESVAPGAYTKTFAERGPTGDKSVKVLFNHGHDPTLGRQALGVPEVLREDENGPYYELELFASVPPLLTEGLRAGAYGASYMFEVVREEWDYEPEESDHNPAAIPERRIIEVKLYEFGPVTFPADEGATAGVRSLTSKFRTLDNDAPPCGTRPKSSAATTKPTPPVGTSGTHAQRVAFIRAAQLRNR